jgi:hypothetical protein
MFLTLKLKGFDSKIDESLSLVQNYIQRGFPNLKNFVPWGQFRAGIMFGAF